jgi:hypothetical protein
MPGLDRFLDIGLPGLVFLGLCAWLIRKAMKAARTERDLEEERLEGTFAEELRAARARAAASQRPNLVAVAPPEPEAAAEAPPRDPLAAADVHEADPAHLPLVAGRVREREQLLRTHVGPTDVERRVEVLWVRSNATHAVWCERRHATTPAAGVATRDVICVAQIEGGAVVERWSFG